MTYALKEIKNHFPKPSEISSSARRSVSALCACAVQLPASLKFHPVLTHYAQHVYREIEDLQASDDVPSFFKSGLFKIPNGLQHCIQRVLFSDPNILYHRSSCTYCAAIGRGVKPILDEMDHPPEGTAPLSEDAALVLNKAKKTFSTFPSEDSVRLVRLNV